MHDDIGQRIDSQLGTEGERDPDLSWVVGRGRRLRTIRRAAMGMGAAALIAAGSFAIVALPTDEHESLRVVGDETPPVDDGATGPGLVEDMTEQEQAEVFAFRALAHTGLMDPFGEHSYNWTYRDDTSETEEGWRIGFAASDCAPRGNTQTCRGLSGEDDDGNAATDTYLTVALTDGRWRVLALEGNVRADDATKVVGFELPDRDEPSHWDIPAVSLSSFDEESSITMLPLWVGPFPTSAPASECVIEVIDGSGAVVRREGFTMEPPDREFERAGGVHGRGIGAEPGEVVADVDVTCAQKGADESSDEDWAIEPEDVVAAYGSRGDIWVALLDGSTMNLTDSAGVREANPTISWDGETIVFEREGELVYIRLDTGENAVFAHGQSPAFGPLGYLAWDNVRGEIVIGTPFNEWRISAPNGPDGQGGTAFNLAWDQSIEVIYYDLVFGHTSQPYYIDVYRVDGWRCSECGEGLEFGPTRAITPEDGTTGDFHKTSFGFSVDVLRLCCRTSEDDPWETVEIGGLEPLDSGVTYHQQRALDDVELDINQGPLVLAHAGQLAAMVEGDRVQWRVTDRHAWFVGDGKRTYLVRWRAEAIRLPYVVDGGIAVSPKVAGSTLINSI